MGALDRLRHVTEGRALPRERRDPKAATTQLRYTSPSMPQVPEWDANQAVRFGYLANVIAYRCVQIIADTIAARPFRAGLTPPERPGQPTEHNPTARLAQLLGPLPGAAAPNLPARKLWQWSVVQRLVTGRNGWEIEVGANDSIVALWPLTSANLKAYPTASGTDWFRAFAYGRDDDLRSLTPDQVHYGWDPHPQNFREPVSSLMSSRYDLSIALASDRYNFGFLKNNAVPAHVVVVDAFAESEDYEAFKRQWAGAYTGPDAANKTHFHEADREDDPSAKLSESIYIQTLGVSSKDAQFIQQHRASLERVAISLGVPWSKLDASGRTFDNADAEDEAFWQGTILPVADKLAEEVNASLAPRLGSEVGWFDLSGIRALRGRPPVPAPDAAALVMAGIAGVDEVRPWYGLTGPAPERVEAVQQLALPPSTEDEPDDDEPGTVDRSGRGDPEAARRGRQEEEARRVAAQGDPDPGQEVRATEQQELRRAAIWKATSDVVVNQEGIWERKFRQLFARQREVALSRLLGQPRKAIREGVDTPSTDSPKVRRLAAICEARSVDEFRAINEPPFDPAFWRDETEDLARDLYEQLSALSFARLSSDFGISFDLEAEFAQLFIGNQSNRLAGQVTDTTYSQITQAMMDGVAEGESIPKIAARIGDVFEQATTNRATVIARTEVLAGFNASSHAAASSLPPGVVAAKQWIATRDGRTRPTHGHADGQIVAVDQPFLVGGAAAMYPGDPALPAKESIQCRCALVFLDEDTYAAEVALQMEAQASVPVPIERARVALALVTEGLLDEPRFRRALEVAS